MTLVGTVNSIISNLIILGQVIFVVLLIGFLVQKFKKKNYEFLNFIGRHAIIFGFVISFTATLGSLYYSEIAGYAPCSLCWLQRIFIYPQTILFLIALIKKEKIFDHALALSIIGGLIAIYHHYIQLGGSAIKPCPILGNSASCAERFVMDYGYLTIPMMSLTAFALIAIIMLIGKKTNSV